jgi:hypothetical protein
MLANPVEMSDPKMDSPETMHKEHNTLGPNKTKKTEEVQDLSNASRNTTSVSLDRGGDEEKINEKGDEQK